MTEDGSVSAVSALLQQYRTEFESAFEGLRRNAGALQEQTQQQLSQAQELQPKVDEVVATLQDTEPVSSPTGTVVRAMAWSAVLVAGLSVGAWHSYFLFHPIAHLFFGSGGLAILTFLVLPYFGYQFMVACEEAKRSDSEIRFALLGWSVLEGGALGALVSPYFVFAEPLAAVFPLALTVAYSFLGNSLASSRPNLIGVSVGGALAASVLTGILFSTLAPSFLLTSVLYAASSFVFLQLLFKYVRSPEAPAYAPQLVYVTLFAYSKGLTYLLFGSHERFEQPQK